MSAGIGQCPGHDSAPGGRHKNEKAIVLAQGLAAVIVSMLLTLVVPTLSLIQNRCRNRWPTWRVFAHWPVRHGQGRDATRASRPAVAERSLHRA